MTPPTDERIAELLRDTFTAHEQLADPTRLTVPSPLPARRRGGVVVGLVAAAAVVVAALAVTESGSGPAGPPPPHDPIVQRGPVPTQMTDEVNMARTEVVADRLLHSVPLLPEGTEVGDAPVGRLARAAETIDASPNTVTHTSWWTGPSSVTEAVHYYLDHPPRGLVATDGGSSSDGRGGLQHEVQYADERPNQSYTARFVLLTVVPDGNGVGVRGDTFVNWRPARTGSSLVGNNVTAIVARELRAHRLGDTPHVVRRATVTEPAEIAAVLRVVNSWYGVAPVTRDCRLPREPVHSYVLRFRTGYGPVVMRGTSICGGGVQLIRRGQAVAPLLDGAVPFQRLVRRLGR